VNSKPAALKVAVLSSNPKTTAVIEQTLRKFDYNQIQKLDNGLEALKVFRDQAPGFLICDMSVKFLAGWMLIKEIKTSDKIPNFPVMLLGEPDAPAPEDELKQYGIVKYLKVPFRDADLSFLINSTLQLANTSGTIENKYTLAKKALIDNDAKAAVERYEELHGLTKKSVRSSLGLAEAYVQTGNLEKAGDVILDAAKNGDANPAALMMQSGILLKRNQKEEAFEVTKKLILEIMPTTPFYFSKSLKLYMDHNDIGHSEGICQYALERTFKLPEFLLTLSRCKFQLEKTQESLDLLKTAETEYGLSPDLLNLRGVCQKKLGDYTGALQSYEEALRLSPMDAKIYFNMASCAISMKNYEAAAKHYESCLKISPAFPKAKEKLEELYSKGNVKRAS
jgi:tetratricopeptide (TPR) repeat protein